MVDARPGVSFASLPVPHLEGELLTVAPPEGSSRSVILVPGIHGLTPHILGVAQRLALSGFRAIVADWFCTSARRGELRGPQDVAPAVVALDDAAIAEGLAGVADTARASGPVGVLGYCVGATMALLSGCRTDATSATVAYYGVLRYRGALEGKGPDPMDELKAVRSPVLGHFGTADGWCPAEDVDELEATLAATGGAHEVYRYPGAGHAFEELGRPGYRAVAADDAARRTLAFLDHHLKR